MNSYTKGDVVVLEPEGKIMPGTDTGALDEKLYALLGQGQKKVIIDLGKTAWVGSSALTILLHHNCKFKESGGSLKLAGLTRKIQQLIVVTKLVLVFEVYDTLEDALDSFKK
jgi:anti-sigma B factor antagonist